jgi:hypothetical protein
MVVDGRPGQPEFGADVVDTHRVVTTTGEQSRRGLDEFLLPRRPRVDALLSSHVNATSMSWRACLLMSLALT